MKKNISTILMILFFFMGLGILSYPIISNYTNNKLQSKAIEHYEKIISDEKKDFSSNYKEAQEYNKKLIGLFKPLITYKKLGDYSSILDVSNNGMIGYLIVEKSRIELPIYAGANEDNLLKGVGQLGGSSLPVGGKSTHSVLSAHRGLPSSKLFTDVDKLEIGDTFVIKVLDMTLTYEIDQILIVKPDELGALEIVKNMDYVTLMTCTPYGINTHRMLIRGHRIENQRPKTYVSNEAYKINNLLISGILSVPLLILGLLLMAFKPAKNEINLKNIRDKYLFPNKYLERNKV